MAWTYKHRVRSAIIEAVYEALGMLRARPSERLQGGHIQEKHPKGEIWSSSRQMVALWGWITGGSTEGWMRTILEISNHIWFWYQVSTYNGEMEEERRTHKRAMWARQIEINAVHTNSHKCVQVCLYCAGMYDSICTYVPYMCVYVHIAARTPGWWQSSWEHVQDLLLTPATFLLLYLMSLIENSDVHKTI